MKPTVRVLALGMLAAAVAASACSGERASEVFVGSASSFAHVIDSAGDTYADYDLKVLVAGSQSLATQVADHAPLDLVITADLATMTAVVATGRTTAEPALVARNRLAIAVEADNPLGISSLGDLTRPDVKVVVAAPEVPLGAYTARVLEMAQLDLNPVSLPGNASAVAGLIASGEADAGIVYETDLAVWNLTSVTLPEELNVNAEYYVVPISGTQNPEGTADFIEFLLGPEGQSVLSELGFSK